MLSNDSVVTTTNKTNSEPLPKVDGREKAARELHEVMQNHRNWINVFRNDYCPAGSYLRPFVFETLPREDGADLTFVARPMSWDGTQVVETGVALDELNDFGESLLKEYNAWKIINGNRCGVDEAFEVSGALHQQGVPVLEPMSDLYDHLKFDREEYDSKGMFVFKITVKEPAPDAEPESRSAQMYALLQRLHNSACSVMQQAHEIGIDDYKYYGV